MAKVYTIDTHAVTEMFWTITNDGAMKWRNWYDACITNLQKKNKKGIFDAEKAAKLLGYMVYEYEREYAKEWDMKRMNKAEREAVARMMVDDILDNDLLS